MFTYVYVYQVHVHAHNYDVEMTDFACVCRIHEHDAQFVGVLSMPYVIQFRLFCRFWCHGGRKSLNSR